jgi:hypothetical protein
MIWVVHLPSPHSVHTFVQTQVVPTRKVRGKKKGGTPAAAAAAEAEAGEEEDGEEDGEGSSLNPEDLLPRTDISASITPALLAMIGSSNWKERNAGVDQVSQLLAEASQRIAPNVGELLQALKVCCLADCCVVQVWHSPGHPLPLPLCQPGWLASLVLAGSPLQRLSYPCMHAQACSLLPLIDLQGQETRVNSLATCC